MAATAMIGGPSVFAEESSSTEQIANHGVFTKPLGSMEVEVMAERLAAMGLGGIECPVRGGGRIDPQRIGDELPPVVEGLAKHDLTILVMASDINDPADPLTEVQLRTAATLGVPAYRMRYFRYERGKDLRPQIDRWRGQMKDLAAMNHEFGIQGLYQNHADFRMFGGPIWDLHSAIADIDPDHLGVAFDLRHATVEGGYSWQLAWELIQDHVRALYVKDFAWRDGKTVNLPLGEGQTSSEFYRSLSDAMKRLPISLHEEYLDHRRPDLVEKHLEFFAKDYATLRGWLAG